jgi:hypothetical protein
MATLRNLKIKTSTCKRIIKELRSYEKEVEKEAAKTADMKEKGADPYDLKQQVTGLLMLKPFFLYSTKLLTSSPCDPALDPSHSDTEIILCCIEDLKYLRLVVI